jgi:isoleucyl-tRNA synthetase
VNQALEAYRYDDAANTIYQFFWGSFCDWYLEIVKLRLDFSETADKAQTAAALTTLVSVFEAALRLLSPFMPFITEEIWHALYDGNPPAKSIALIRRQGARAYRRRPQEAGVRDAPVAGEGTRGAGGAALGLRTKDALRLRPMPAALEDAWPGPQRVLA